MYDNLDRLLTYKSKTLGIVILIIINTFTVYYSVPLLSQPDYYQGSLQLLLFSLLRVLSAMNLFTANTFKGCIHLASDALWVIYYTDWMEL